MYTMQHTEDMASWGELQGHLVFDENQGYIILLLTQGLKKYKPELVRFNL